MQKLCVYLSAALIISGLIFVSAYSQEDEMLVVDNKVFENPQRPAAAFRHDEHNENAAIEECNICHHIYEDGKLLEDESSEDQLCSECHDLTASGNQPALRKAFHINCKGCHKKNGKGPIMCGECHKKYRSSHK